MSLLNDHYISSTNIFLSSDQAEVSHSSSRKTFYFRKALNVPRNSHMMLALTSFNMPYSFYLIRAGVNDTFKIATYHNSSLVVKKITLPEGNYSIGELVPAINTIFITESLDLGTTFFLTMNYTTNKFYITSSVQMDSVIFSDVLCYKILGFENSTDVYSYNSLSTLNMPNVADFSGNSCLYVTIQNRGIQNVNSSHIDGVLQQINVECLPLEYIYYRPVEIQYFETSSEHVNHFDVSILDENFQEIELNGGIFRITFTIHFNYNKEVITEHITEKIKGNDDEEQNKTIEKEKQKNKRLMYKTCINRIKAISEVDNQQPANLAKD